MRDVILGVDVGTSSLKAGLFTLEGQSLGLTSATYTLSSPEPDAMEQDPDDWWRAFVSVSRELWASGDGGIHVAAVAIGGQAPTLCTVDAELRATSNAISWLDQRPGAVAEELYASLGREVPVWGSWPAQAAWFVRHRPEAMRKTRWLLGCPEYLAARLTRVPVAFLAWADDEIRAAEIDEHMLPPLKEPGDIVGQISPEAAVQTGLGVGTPVVAGFVDGILGVLGSGVSRVGDACLNAGTSGTLSVLAQPGAAYPVLGMYVAGAATNTSGKALDWFVHHVAGPGADYAQVLAGAAEVEPGARGLVFVPHLAGERNPVWDPRSRGVWTGLTLEHDRRHLVRSILEGVAFSFRSIREMLARDGADANEIRIVGGQARSALWNQIKADVLNVPVLVPEVVEGPVVGAAILGALGLRAYADRSQAAAAMVHIAERLEPSVQAVKIYDELYDAYMRLYPAVRDINWYLHDLAPLVPNAQAGPGAGQ